MLPDEVGMEGCPERHTLLYLILAALLVPFLFVCYKLCAHMYRRSRHKKEDFSRQESMRSVEFAQLQLELFGEKALKNLKHLGSSHDLDGLAASVLQSKKRRVAPASTVELSVDEERGFGDFMAYLNGPIVPIVHM